MSSAKPAPAGQILPDLLASGPTLPDPLPGDPMPLAKEWYDLAHAQKVQPNPNAMTVATVDADGQPSARVVLCRTFNISPGYVVFFTNGESRKGRALAANPRASGLFHWDALDRQIRIEGPVVKSPAAESDAYFARRPWQSRLAAWASDQSRPLGSRHDLAARVTLAAQRLGLDLADIAARDDAVVIPRPPHWGGYRIWARQVELWLGGPSRLHDRALWSRTLAARGEDFDPGPWQSTRLMP